MAASKSKKKAGLTNVALWARTKLAIRYHDEEWGVYRYTMIAALFEFLVLEGAQAGLSIGTPF